MSKEKSQKNEAINGDDASIREFIAQQKPMDADIEQILIDSAWDLYITDQPT